SFFFQAEDGIRDRNVTGVQTCALPICFVALAKAQSLCPDTPFIFVSGTHTKEAADETRKRATIDCVFTTSLAELPSTFDRAIKEIGRESCRERVKSWEWATWWKQREVR